ncbi:hypothetical protein Tco_1492628 [Tanacetum coccineum]
MAMNNISKTPFSSVLIRVTVPLFFVLGLNDMNLFHLWILFSRFSSTPSSELFFSSAYSSFDLKANEDSGFVINLPEQMLVGEFLPPYYISQLEDSIIISGSFNFGDVCFIDAWELEVDDGEVSSYRQLFTIPYPVDHKLKIIGFTKDKQPIVEASFLQQFHQSLQVFNPSFQSFQNVGVKANHGSFFVGQYKESLMLVNEQSMGIIF